MLISFVGLQSCSKSSQSNNDLDICISHFLEEFDMQPYDGEDLACKFHIIMYEHEGVYFSVLNSHCADLVQLTIYDCDGNVYCKLEDSPCQISGRTLVGVIGMDK